MMICSLASELSVLKSRVPFRRRFVAMVLASCAWLSGAPKGFTQESLAQAIDREGFLRAISEVETGGNSRAVGRAGERGMYQFRRQTWQQYTSRSFYDAHNPVVARTVASKHFDWLLEGFQRNGRKPSTYLMAAAWNAGFSRALSGRMPGSTRDYARRVSNIVAATTPQTIPSFQRRLFVASSTE